MKMKDKLKPCPFCGSESSLKEGYDEYNKIIGYKVGCSNLDCFCWTGIDYISNKEDLIKNWNNRINE